MNKVRKGMNCKHVLQNVLHLYKSRSQETNKDVCAIIHSYRNVTCNDTITDLEAF